MSMWAATHARALWGKASLTMRILVAMVLLLSLVVPLGLIIKFQAGYNSIRYFDEKYPLPLGDVRDGVYLTGCRSRAVTFAKRLQKGVAVRVGMLGGSFSIGGSTYAHMAFAKYANVHIVNAALGGSNAALADVCLSEFLGAEPFDLVLLEYNINNGMDFAQLGDERLVVMERLIRRILALPGEPAVILVQFNFPKNSPGWVDSSSSHKYFRASEDMMAPIAQYYKIPWVSMRSSLFYLEYSETPGFKPEELRGDGLHYSPKGHSHAAAMLMHLLSQVATCPQQLPGSEALGPMFKSSEPFPTSCVVGPRMQECRSSGWAYIKDPLHRKSAMVAHTPGSVLHFDVPPAKGPIRVNVVHVKSYHNVGMARITCHNCTCKDTVIDAHWPDRVTLIVLHPLELASVSPGCRLSVTLLPKTTTNATKFMLTGFILAPANMNGTITGYYMDDRWR